MYFVNVLLFICCYIYPQNYFKIYSLQLLFLLKRSISVIEKNIKSILSAPKHSTKHLLAFFHSLVTSQNPCTTNWQKSNDEV